jgi:hypothetical protein
LAKLLRSSSSEYDALSFLTVSSQPSAPILFGRGIIFHPFLRYPIISSLWTPQVGPGWSSSSLTAVERDSSQCPRQGGMKSPSLLAVQTRSKKKKKTKLFESLRVFSLRGRTVSQSRLPRRSSSLPSQTARCIGQTLIFVAWTAGVVVFPFRLDNSASETASFENTKKHTATTCHSRSCGYPIFCSYSVLRCVPKQTS